jgi:hyperosmotically inducible periplasmic protein
MNRRSMLGATVAILTLPLIGACDSMRGHSSASSSRTESAGEYIDDATITTKVKAALVESKEVKAREVNVETYRGVVQLSGFVSTQAEALKAAELARSVKGVQSVKNDIRIKPAS